MRESPTKLANLKTLLTKRVTTTYLSTSLVRSELKEHAKGAPDYKISTLYREFGLFYSGTIVERSYKSNRQHYIVTLLLGGREAVKGKHRLSLSVKRDVTEFIYPTGILRSNLDTVRLLKRLGSNCNLSSGWLSYLK